MIDTDGDDATSEGERWGGCGRREGGDEAERKEVVTKGVGIG